MTCSFRGCPNPRNYADGLCNAHRWQQDHTGRTWPLWTNQRRRADVIEDCEDLAGAGSVEAIARRIYPGSPDPVDSLYQTLRRAKRLDLWQRITRREAA